MTTFRRCAEMVEPNSTSYRHCPVEAETYCADGCWRCRPHAAEYLAKQAAAKQAKP